MCIASAQFGASISVTRGSTGLGYRIVAEADGVVAGQPDYIVAPHAADLLELTGVPTAIATVDGRRLIASLTWMARRLRCSRCGHRRGGA